MPSYQQIVTLPFLYVNGMNLAVASNTTATVTTGQCRDSSNQEDIYVSTASTTIDFGVRGLNGLDTGSIAASTDYAVYAIYSPTNANTTSPAGFIVSASFTAPTLPETYSLYRRIGVLKTDGSSHLLPFYQSGTGSVKSYWWDTPIVVANTITSSFVTKTLTAGMPPLAIPVYLGGTITPNAAGDTLFARQVGSSSTNGTSLVSGDVASVANVMTPTKVLTTLSSSVPSIQLKASSSSDTISIVATGFDDML